MSNNAYISYHCCQQYFDKHAFEIIILGTYVCGSVAFVSLGRGYKKCKLRIPTLLYSKLPLHSMIMTEVRVSYYCNQWVTVYTFHIMNVSNTLISTFYSQNRGKNAVTKVIAYVFFLIADVFFGLHSGVTLIFATKVSAITFFFF